MERTIGNLGEEIRQPSNPYANLSQRGLFRCQVNALTAMIPSLSPPPPSLPRGAVDLGQGYVLLRTQDRYERLMRPQEASALLYYLGGALAEGSSESINCNWCPKVTRWAWLRLPNGQVARSHWKESLKPLRRLRIARNVKVGHFLIKQFSRIFTLQFSYLVHLRQWWCWLRRSPVLFLLQAPEHCSSTGCHLSLL